MLPVGACDKKKKQVRRSIYEFLWVNSYLKCQFSHFLLFLSESSQLALVKHTTEPKGTIIIYWKCILGVYCNFFLCQTHTAASAGSSGDDWLLWEWTCGRVIPGFDRLRRMASALCAKKRPLQKMLSGCRSVLGENVKNNSCPSVCVWVCVSAQGQKNAQISLCLVRFAAWWFIILLWAMQFRLHRASFFHHWD